MEFNAWMYAVDRFVERFTGGLSVYDLVDCPFRGWFDDEMSPADAARKAIARTI